MRSNQREAIHVKIKAGGSRRELAKLFKKIAKAFEEGKVTDKTEEKEEKRHHVNQISPS